ncbi:MAG: lamin tail domain-containing protein [Lewinellaceae bacterium]|nr:lamin tail domain-containing protein [Lewinellaceae bacterium]
MISSFTQGNTLGCFFRGRQRGFTRLLFLFLMLNSGWMLAQPMSCSQLFISEYVEGSSNNKAIEIYNPTAGSINLTGYQLRFYFNGAGTVGTTIILAGTIAAGDVWVVVNSAASAPLLALADQTIGGSWYNGDDAVDLYNGNTMATLDVIGQIGFDPGSEWGTGLTSTADNTIRRKTSVGLGDSNGADAFDPSIQWDGFATDAFDGLGAHTATACSCNLSSTGLFDVHCEDNNETFDNNTDDYIWFQLNPVGTGLGSGYNVTVDSGSVTLNGYLPPTNVPYGVSNYFRLQSGSAGSGNRLVTVTDASTGQCSTFSTIFDPGPCSSQFPDCDLTITDIDSTNETCNNDGSIVVTATCTDCTGLEYSINGINYQTFGTFSNLPNGTYYVYVQDSLDNQCSASYGPIAILNGDDVPPVFTAPLPPDTLTISCSDPIPPLPMLAATDNVTQNVMISSTIATTPGNCPQNSTIVRTFTATDDCGNTAQFTQTINIVDGQAPVFNGPLPSDITLSCDATLPVAPQLTATDNCDPGQVPPVIFINEIHYDNVGTDADEFIELAGTAGLDLSQYAIVLYNGNGGVEYGTMTLSGLIDNEGSGFGAVSFPYPVNGIQNGSPDGLALIKLPSTVLQFLSYEGTFLATNGLAMGMTSVDIGVLEDGSNALGTSVQITGAGQVYSDFSWTGPTTASAGTLNGGQTITALPGTIIATYQETSMMGNCAGDMIVKRNWTATDACGNSATHMQTITLLDGTAPTFVAPLPQNITISCSDPVPPVATLVATDNCDNGAGTAMVWINEMHYDNVGGDVGEFVEVAGTAGTDLSGYSLFLYNGAGGGTYSSMALSGTIDNESNGFGAVDFMYPANGLQNGAPDGVALVHGGTVVQFLSYEGVFMAVGGPANGMTSTDIGVAELGSDPIGLSIALTGNGNTYADFIWNPPAPQSPGVINPGQTFVAVPVGLQVTFNETIAQGPGTCPYAKTITRTWTVSDDCNNTNTHQQIITIQDATAPVVTCQPITVPLDITGSVTITQANITYSATDNCSPSASLIYNPASLTLTCANAGTVVPFTLTVTDECGNTGSCTISVTVPAYDRCTPVIEITDPCVCKNNATTLTNGQFGEMIRIQSLTNQVWTILSVNGFYSAASPAPPSAPIPFLPGATFTEMPAGSGDYFLNGLHVDAIGYTLTVRNQAGATLQIGNSCAYPNPVINSDLTGPFCLYSDPVNLTGDPGDANFISAMFTVNGVPTNVFNPGMGVGQYAIVYTVDGGTPKDFGPNDPGCIQKVTKLVNVQVTPTTLTCNDLVQISLDADCQTEILPDMILEGSYGCYDDYIVEIDKTLPLGNGPWVPAILTAADIGKTYAVRVTHLVSGNMCWGNVSVEDKLPPVLVCNNLNLSCAIMDYTPAYLSNVLGVPNVYPTVTENCSSYTSNYSDTFFDLGCSGSFNGVSDLSAYVRRDWVVTDASGNQSTCTQYLYFKRRHVEEVLLPGDVTVSCSNPVTSPSATGTPYLMEYGHVFSLYPNNSYCELQTVYSDQILPVCDGTYKILRTWTVYDWCQPTNPNPPNPNPVYWVQVIKVQDIEGPGFACPQPLTVSTDPFVCYATPDLPDVIITDNCSRIASITAKYQVNNITSTLNGSLTSFPGNNLWNPDTLGQLGYAQNLPLGITPVTYTVTDDCGNSTVCTFNLTVEDQTPPVVACDQFTQVSLGLNGESFVYAETFDDGSYDNCANVNFKVRRMDANGCDPNNAFDDQVKFCCEDVGDTIIVVLRVYDVPVNTGEVSLTYQEVHSNDCMVQVFVSDKIKPVCTPPANTTVSCENFDPSLWAYGNATPVDNCCLDDTKEYLGQIGLTHTVNYSQFDTLCNKGTIVRTFRAFDCYGNSSQCTQRIVVNYEQDYYVKFPNDVIVTECNGSGNYGEPIFFGEDCELLGVSYQDEIFTVVPDACFKIERSWTIINWCTYNPNLPCTVVPNPNPNAISSHPSNLPGPIVSAPGIPAPWAPTVVKINPTDAQATNYSVFWSANANCYQYKQIIKIIDTEKPVLDCNAIPIALCDQTTNDPLFWNNAAWWDPIVGSHDLCENDADISIVGTDSCSGANITIRYLLYLDMDGDGTMETVVSSTNPPAPGTVNYGNAGNPNFSGGTPIPFDNRPVPTNQKYQFNVQSTVSGNLRTAFLKWNTQQQPNAYVSPKLPYGNHKIKWIATDGCGNETVCERQIQVKDCKKPTVVCLNGLSVNIMPTGMIQLWASDFLQYGEDNCTPANMLQFAVVESDESTGTFPLDAQGNPQLSVTFDCSEVGTQAVQLWAIDLAGNADFCETYVIVQDNNNNCGAAPISVAGALATEQMEGVEEASVHLSGTHPALPPISMFDMSDNQGGFLFSNALPIASNFTLAPLKDDNPLNGVTTYDLVLISKHILGLQPLDTPYKMIAADANKSNSITTFDIVELRKLILGIYPSLPLNTSWRFVDRDYVFPSAGNPFFEPFPETKSYADVQADMMYNDFVGVKIGDVNGSAIPNGLLSSDDRSSGTLLIDLQDQIVAPGDVIEVQFKADRKVEGYQFTLALEHLEVLNILTGESMSADNFAVFPSAGAITTSYDGKSLGVFTVRFRATSNGVLRNMIKVSSSSYQGRAFLCRPFKKLDVALRFNGEQGQTLNGVGFRVYQNSLTHRTTEPILGSTCQKAAVQRLPFMMKRAGCCTSNRAILKKATIPLPSTAVRSIQTVCCITKFQPIRIVAP